MVIRPQNWFLTGPHPLQPQGSLASPGLRAAPRPSRLWLGLPLTGAL